MGSATAPGMTAPGAAVPQATYGMSTFPSWFGPFGDFLKWFIPLLCILCIVVPLLLWCISRPQISAPLGGFSFGGMAPPPPPQVLSGGNSLSSCGGACGPGGACGAVCGPGAACGVTGCALGCDDKGESIMSYSGNGCGEYVATTTYQYVGQGCGEYSTTMVPTAVTTRIFFGLIR